LSPRATRPPKEGPAQPSTRRRPSLPTRGRKAAANGASAGAPDPGIASTVDTAATETPREPISWIEMSQPAASVPHMAMPKLMGQPAYARPPRPLAVETPRPLDPDDLPIEAFRSEEDQQLAARLARRAELEEAQGATLRPSSVGGLRSIAGRLLGRG
jgi:hypothetical protein